MKDNSEFKIHRLQFICICAIEEPRQISVFHMATVSTFNHNKHVFIIPRIKLIYYFLTLDFKFILFVFTLFWQGISSYLLTLYAEPFLLSDTPLSFLSSVYNYQFRKCLYLSIFVFTTT